jgi:Ca2+-binding RTX toxin-like protein
MPTITGTPDDDVLTGTAEPDTIDALGGNDRAEGLGGDDIISGGDGDDILIGDVNSVQNSSATGDDVIDGGAGADIIVGGLGDDVLSGGDGNDRFFNGLAAIQSAGSLSWHGGSHATGADTIDGGAGSDHATLVYANRTANISFTFDGANPAQTFIMVGGVAEGSVVNVEGVDFVAGSGNDAITVLNSIHNSYLDGGGGDDVLIASDGGSWIRGDAGDDVCIGGDGRDLIYGGAGADELNGGDGGMDLLSYFGSAAGVVVNLADGTASGGDAEGDVISGFEDLEGHLSNDVLTGNSLANWIEGSWGDDQVRGLDGDDRLFGSVGVDELFGGEGADWLDGGDGADTASYADGAAVVVDLGLSGAQDTGGAGVDTLIGIENLTGSAFDDILIGDAGANVLLGGDGADFIDGGGGDDTLLGGAGDDTIEVGGSSALMIDGGAGIDTLSYAAASTAGTMGVHIWLDADSTFENVTGSGLSDDLMGNAGDNILRGGEGQTDYLEGGGGDDVLDGGEGDADIASYIRAPGSVAVSLALEGVAQNTLADGFDTLLNIERLEGSTFDDVLTGSAGNDILDGYHGNDVMYGGAGDDLFWQHAVGDFVDTIFGEAGADTLYYGTSGSDLVVQMGGGYVAVAGRTLAVFSGIENVEAGGGDDALIGDAADNRLDGSSGSDWIVGGGGDDWLVERYDLTGVDRLFGGAPGADAGFDTIDYSSSGLGVIVQLSGYTTANDAARTLFATFSGIEAAVGSGFGDVLIGNAADNVLAGGAGADWLVGAAGDDTFVQSIDASSIDRLFGDAGIDTIDYSSAGAGVVVQLSGYSTSGGATLATFTGIENAIGTAFNDVLVGNASDNRIAGGQGADWLVGGAGNDAFVQDIQTGVDTIFGDAGTDTIDYSGASAGVTVQLSGYAASGGATLATFAGIEGAIGSAFNDALIGNASANSLTGGAGGDWLVGGGGADTFVYKTIADGAGDSIRDFSQVENDLIDLSAIDANATTGGDQSFSFATSRTAGLVGEAVVTSASATVTMLSLYLDADNVADMVVQIVHQPGVIMDASDFVL